MRLARLFREATSDEGTFGTLMLDAERLHSLELPWRDNRKQVSCIPAGQYVCELVRSPKFGLIYEVTFVPGRSHVLIHPANFGGDASRGWTTQLQGCIAPCYRLGRMKNNQGGMQAAGLVSRPAVQRLMTWAAGDRFTLEIQDDFSTD